MQKKGILSSYIWLHLGNYEYVVLQRVYVTRRWRRNGKGKREEGERKMDKGKERLKKKGERRKHGPQTQHDRVVGELN